MRFSSLALLCCLNAACWQHRSADSPQPQEESMFAQATHAHAPSGSTLPPLETDRYACRRCGRVLFHADEVVQVRPLWDLGEERNEVYVLRSASGLPTLRRYDTSLHEGWYCCRFALMRMVVDKFGTGDHLLAYTGDVVRVPAGQEPRPGGGGRAGQIQVTAADFDSIIGADHGDHLTVVKLSATWCPPCRLVDTAIARIDAAGSLPDVRFYEADVDAEPELGDRFSVRSLPTLRFWYRGRPLQVHSERMASVSGALVGGMSQRTLESVTAAVLRAARAGQRDIALP
jgi:thioredoxin 2